MLKYIGITVLLLSFHISSCLSQEIEVSGGFIQERIKLGEPVQYYLTAKYPNKFEVLFPDQEYPFSPFEILEKEYFPSTYDSAFVIDSAVYTLTSFEIDPFQILALPVFLIAAGDSVRIEAAADSLQFVEAAPNATDTTTLKTDLAYTNVALDVNYPYILIGLGIFLLVLILIAAFFGKRIINHFKIRRVKKGFSSFSVRFDELVQKVVKSEGRDNLENTIAYWKKYLERLEKKPYTKLTTKELVALKGDDRLKKELKVIDRNLYGHLRSDDLITRLQSIKNLAKEYQEKKIASIKNG